MKKRKQFIQLFLIAGILFGAVAACDKSSDKSDDPPRDFPSAGTVTDADGNEYNTVIIGKQVWMVENLKTTTYNDGTPIPYNITDHSWGQLSKGEYFNYDNLESNAEIYGRLYNWYAVNTGKLAPTGWHVPTIDDWNILKKFVAANPGSSGNEAKALASKTNWATSTNVGAIGNNLNINNSTGFTALPGGCRHYAGSFQLMGSAGIWWSSSYIDYAPYVQSLGSNTVDFISSSRLNGEEQGYSVRCVRD